MATLQPISLGKSKTSKKSKGKKSTLATIGLTPAVTIGNLITRGLEKITGRKFGTQKASELSRTKAGKALGVATLGAGAALAGAINPAATARVAKSAASAVGRAAARRPALTLVGAGVVASGAGPSVVKTLFKAGKTSGEVITGEKTLNAETIADVGKGLGVALGIGALGTAAGFAGKKLLERDGEETPEGMLGAQPVNASQIGTAIPITPETEIISQGATKTRRRTRLQPRREKIMQSVRVQVMAGNKTNKFIKNAVYA